MKRILLLAMLISLGVLGNAQNALRSGDGWGSGWSTNDYFSATGFGSVHGKAYVNSNTTSATRAFRFGTDWGGAACNGTIWGPSGTVDVTLAPGTVTPLQVWNATNNKAYNLATILNTKTVFFRTRAGDNCGASNNPDVVAFVVTAVGVALPTISTVTREVNDVYTGQPINVAATLSTAAAVPAGMAVYLRYSTDNFTTSTVVAMTHSASGVYNVAIPATANTAGATIKYYALLSGSAQSPTITSTPTNADLYTISGNNNGGSNYSYTVASSFAALNGSFSGGSTFSGNGWAVANGAQANKWFIGTAPNVSVFSGNTSAYISDNATGTTHNYNNALTSIVHFYRDITFPTGQSANISFKWYANGESATLDHLRVFLVPTSTVITPGTAVASGQIGATYNLLNTVQTASIDLNQATLGNCAGSSTMRLVFSWNNDSSGGSQFPAAIDDIAITTAAPAISAAGGTFTIDNTVAPSSTNFTNFTSAINALNGATACAALTGGVTFNVSGSNYPENPPAIIASGTASFPIVFQKAGGTPTIVPTGTAGAADAGLIISGADYVTIDGININASASNAVEYGYLIRNASATNGAQNNTIKNTSIQLNRGGANSSYAIFQTASSTGGGVTPTVATGANSTNLYHKISIDGARNGGVYLAGNTSFPDLNCEIGVGATCADRNTITNIGPTTSTFTGAQGIYTSGQSGVKIYNNDISNVTSNQAANAGILMQSYAGTVELYNNKISACTTTGSVTSTSRSVGIELNNTSGTPTARVYNNFIYGITSGYSSTGTATIVVYGIFANNTTTASTAEIDNNTISLSQGLVTVPYSSTCFANASASAIHKMRGNIFANFSAAHATAKHFCIKITSATSIGAAGSVSNYNDLHIQ